LWDEFSEGKASHNSTNFQSELPKKQNKTKRKKKTKKQ